MAKYQNFEQLPVWQEAARLYNVVLDLLEQPNLPLSPGFRSQLDRAGLAIANHVAESYERFTTAERLAALAVARGSSAEVRSMLAAVKDRPKLKPCGETFQRIQVLAESCARQLSGWAAAIENPARPRPASVERPAPGAAPSEQARA